MLESCARFQAMPPAEAADTLTSLVTDLRRVLIHPDMQGAAKLIAIQRLVDEEYAPPPAA